MGTRMPGGNPSEMAPQELVHWLTAKLQAEFRSLASDDLIQECAKEAVCALRDARIRNFVPVLARRRAAERLRASVADRKAS